MLFRIVFDVSLILFTVFLTIAYTAIIFLFSAENRARKKIILLASHNELNKFLISN